MFRQMTKKRGLIPSSLSMSRITSRQWPLPAKAMKLPTHNHHRQHAPQLPKSHRRGRKLRRNPQWGHGTPATRPTSVVAQSPSRQDQPRTENGSTKNERTFPGVMPWKLVKLSPRVNWSSTNPLTMELFMGVRAGIMPEQQLVQVKTVAIQR